MYLEINLEWLEKVPWLPLLLVLPLCIVTVAKCLQKDTDNITEDVLFVVLTLLSTVCVHELGHYLAGTAFGCTTLSLIIDPVAIGFESINLATMTNLQLSTMLLMGPLANILFAFALLTPGLFNANNKSYRTKIAVWVNLLAAELSIVPTKIVPTSLSEVVTDGGIVLELYLDKKDPVFLIIFATCLILCGILSYCCILLYKNFEIQN
jgi:hypothetical protein